MEVLLCPIILGEYSIHLQLLPTLVYRNMCLQQIVTRSYFQLTCVTDEIIELVKGEMATSVQTDNDNQIEDEIPTNATSIEDRTKSKSTSQRSMAIATVRQKRVDHVPEAGTFVVEASKGDKYTVSERLMSVFRYMLPCNSGQNEKPGKNPLRPCDEDQLSVINPAPDSVKKHSFISSTPILTPQSILKKRKATSPVRS